MASLAWPCMAVLACPQPLPPQPLRGHPRPTPVNNRDITVMQPQFAEVSPVRLRKAEAVVCPRHAIDVPHKRIHWVIVVNCTT